MKPPIRAVQMGLPVKPLCALLAVVPLGLGAVACGSADKAKAPAVAASSAVETPVGKPITTSFIPPGQALRGDGDADNPGDTDGNGDIDPDEDQDSPTPASYRFPDGDDKPIFAYGRPASATDRPAIAGIVKRFYTTAAAGDGASACSLLAPDLARSVSGDYGAGSGLPYLRAGKTCQAVMSLLFKHLHAQLAEAVKVVQVRTDGSNAQVVLGSRQMPASYIHLKRQGGSWRMEALLAQPLP